MEFIIFPFAAVSSSINHIIKSLAFHFILFPIAFILGAVAPLLFAMTLLHSICPFANIDRTIRMYHHTCSILKIEIPLTCLFLTIWPSLSSLTFSYHWSGSVGLHLSDTSLSEILNSGVFVFQVWQSWKDERVPRCRQNLLPTP